jgi:hypothetical protein
MAEEIHHPHNMMVRAVLSDLAEATSFLQQHLPQGSVSNVEMVAPMALICKVFFPSISTFETLPI